MNLKDEAYFRYSLLQQLEKITIALERITKDRKDLEEFNNKNPYLK